MSSCEDYNTNYTMITIQFTVSSNCLNVYYMPEQDNIISYLLHNNVLDILILSLNLIIE